MTQAFDERLVFAKTAQGAEEIVGRAHALPPGARRILILVDGRRRLADLSAFARPGELDGIVEDLQARGLVCLAGIADAPDENEVRERERLQRETLEKLQSALTGAFARELGSDGLVLDARLRDCVSLDVMRRLLREAIDTVARRRGERAAARLVEVIRPLYAGFAQRR